MDLDVEDRKEPAVSGEVDVNLEDASYSCVVVDSPLTHSKKDASKILGEYRTHHPTPTYSQLHELVLRVIPKSGKQYMLLKPTPKVKGGPPTPLY